MIKAVIFDLDNTLLDTDKISDQAYQSSIEILNEAGIDKKILSKIEKAYRSGNSFTRVIESFNKHIRCDVSERAVRNYLANQNLSKIKPIDGNFVEYLLSFGAGPQSSPIGCAEPYLVTKGYSHKQREKVYRTFMIPIFGPKKIFYVGQNGTKEKAFEKILKKKKCLPSEILVVGDNIKEEIFAGNKLGMRTMRYCYGRHSKEESQNSLETAEKDAESLQEVFEFVRDENSPEWESLQKEYGMTNLPTSKF